MNNEQMAHFQATPAQIGEDPALAREVLQFYTPFLYHAVIDEFLGELVDTGGHNRGTYNTMELVGDFMMSVRAAEPLTPYEVAAMALGAYFTQIEKDCIGTDEETKPDEVKDITGPLIYERLGAEEDLMEHVALLVRSSFAEDDQPFGASNESIVRGYENGGSFD